MWAELEFFFFYSGCLCVVLGPPFALSANDRGTTTRLTELAKGVEGRCRDGELCRVVY